MRYYGVIAGVVIAASSLPAVAEPSTATSIQVDTTTTVFSVSGDGRARRVTPRGVDHYTPVWAPDGTKFATVSGALEVRGRNGRLLHTIKSQAWPTWPSISWSPHARRLAIVAYRAGRPGSGWKTRLVVTSIGGREKRVLARRHLDGAPIWSPDGRTIYFERFGGARGSIWSVPSAGGKPRKLIEHGTNPALSPDGRWLLFFRFSGPDNGLKLARSDGSGERTLTHDQYAGRSGWLPHRNRAFYFRHDADGYHLRVFTPPGSTHESAGAIPSTAHLVWSPDGQRVAWSAGGYGKDAAVRSARPDGTDIRTLARFTSKSRYTEIDSLSWAPGGRVLVEVHEHWGD